MPQYVYHITSPDWEKGTILLGLADGKITQVRKQIWKQVKKLCEKGELDIHTNDTFIFYAKTELPTVKLKTYFANLINSHEPTRIHTRFDEEVIKLAKNVPLRPDFTDWKLLGLPISLAMLVKQEKYEKELLTIDNNGLIFVSSERYFEEMTMLVRNIRNMVKNGISTQTFSGCLKMVGTIESVGIHQNIDVLMNDIKDAITGESKELLTNLIDTDAKKPILTVFNNAAYNEDTKETTYCYTIGLVDEDGGSLIIPPNENHGNIDAILPMVEAHLQKVRLSVTMNDELRDVLANKVLHGG